MPAAQQATRTTGAYAEIGQVLETALYARGQKLERGELAATLRVLATWLTEQAYLLSAESDADEAGASGNLRLVPARARADAAVLTRREREVALRIARGFSNRQIAEELVITLSTTERHVANILGKLGMRSRAEVAAWAVAIRL